MCEKNREEGERHMMTLKQYAEKCGISYEAVRQLVTRHAEEIGDHIHKQGRTRLLDDTAVQLLDNLRQNQKIIVQRIDPHEEIEALKAENKALLIKLDQLHDELHEEQRKNEQLHIQLQDALKSALSAPSVHPSAAMNSEGDGAPTQGQNAEKQEKMSENVTVDFSVKDNENIDTGKKFTILQRIKRHLWR